MIFRWIDDYIDRKIASSFNLFRKIGRRAERTYYTAYKDWLAFVARRGHDMSVKITMSIITIAFLFLVRGIKAASDHYMQDNNLKLSEMRQLLDRFNTGKSLRELKTDRAIKIMRTVNPEDYQLVVEYYSQRNK
jgi:hypothetical protein